MNLLYMNQIQEETECLRFNVEKLEEKLNVMKLLKEEVSSYNKNRNIFSKFGLNLD